MARTINEIATEIKNTFIANEHLIDLYKLTPGESYDKQFSNASVETCLIYVVATAIATLEWLFDMFRADVDEKIEKAIPGNIAWYWHKIMDFRYGSTLNEWGVYDETISQSNKQIIRYCAITEDIYGLTVKVNKNNYETLNTDEMNALKGYVNKIKFAGTRVSVVSLNPDMLRLSLKVDVDPMVLTTDYNAIGSSTKTDSIATAISNYLSELKYGGVFNKTKLIDAIQAVEGVEDVIITSCEFKIDDNEGTIIELDEQNYTAVSGAIKLEKVNYE